MGKILPYLQLCRAGTLFSPAADVIAGACVCGLAWGTDLWRLMFASVLLYAAGMILNDHADRKLDAEQRPERPIPSGKIAAGTALCLGLACLAGCLLLTPVWAYHGTMALLVLVYDYVIKANVAGGALTMGTLRAMNLLAPCAVVAGGIQADGAIEAGAAYFFYIVAVTLLGILEDAPASMLQGRGGRVVLGLTTVPPLCGSLAMLALPESGYRWAAVVLAFGLAAVFIWRQRGVTDWSQGTIRGAMMWLLLGTMFYTSLLALGTGHWIEALVIVGMLVVARVIARRIALT